MLPASALAQSDPVTDKFELGDSQEPPVSGSGDVAAVAEINGPDWAELFHADGSLKDEVGADGNPPSNGIPDYVDLYGGLDALFVGDSISAGSATDLTIRFGAANVETGPIGSTDDLGNTYVYLTKDAAGNLLLYAGLERIDTGPTTLQLEFNQGHIRLGHGWPGKTGWEVVGQRVEQDLRVSLDFDAQGALAQISVESWEDPESDGYFAWVPKATQSGEGCNAGDPEATPPLDPKTLCAFRNDTAIPGGDWPSYDNTGGETELIDLDCFFELGLNVGQLLGITDPGYAYSTVRLWSPTDLAFGYFGEEGGS